MQGWNLLVAILATFMAFLHAQKGEEMSKFAAQPRLNDTIISCGAYSADACNCVYYARDRQPKLPSGLTTCADKRNKVNSHHASAGCVLFRTGDPEYCHAAYVTKVSDGTIHYDQSNWTHCKCSSDTLSTSSSAIIGFWCP